MKPGFLSPRVALGAAAAAYIAALAAVALGLLPRAWGLNSIHFIAPPARALCLAVSLAGLSLVWSWTGRAGAGGARSGTAAPRPVGGSRGRALSLAAAGAAGLLLWLLRDRSHLLGDGGVWIDNMRAGRFPHYSEPLAVAAWRLYVLLLRALGIAPSPESLAFLPILCGLAAGALSWEIAKEISPSPRARLASFTLLASLGSGMLYFGYIEVYPLVSLAVLGYLLVALRAARGATPRLAVSGALAVALGSHLICTYLIPSYAWSLLRMRAPLWKRLALLLAPVALATAGFWALRYPAAEAIRPFHLLSVAVRSTAETSGFPPGWIGAPFVDLLLLLLLVLPVPVLLLVARAASLRREAGGESPAGRTALAIAALSGLLAAVVLVVPGSPAQDWDLMAMTLLPLAVLAVAEGTRLLIRSPARVGVGLAAISFASLAPFVLVNASEPSALGRLDALVGGTIRLSAHERAYGNEKLARAYMSRREFASALPYARASLAAEPSNARYWTNVGEVLNELGRTGEAIPMLRRAVELAPERWDARYDLGLCYAKEERYPEAADALAGAVRAGGDRPDVRHLWGIALYRSGRVESAVEVWRDLLAQWPDYAARLRGAGAGMAARDSLRP
jgi:tetratricopeptide (TPR) repeat protein